MKVLISIQTNLPLNLFILAAVSQCSSVTLLVLCFLYLRENFSPEAHQLEDFCKTHKSNDLMSNMVPTSMISDYDLGGAGDLFKAPEPIMEEPMMGIDPMTAAISMISCEEDVISRQAFKAADIESLQEQLLSEVFYECGKDLLEKAAMESPLSEVLDMNIPIFRADENQLQENKPLSDVSFQKSVSSECLSSLEWVHEAATNSSFLDFAGMDLDVAFGMRRAFSEGDIKTLSNGSISFVHSPHERPLIISNCTSEERREKLSRYRIKKNKRNFGRKIKYACRKALADSQPRIRGRFAKSEESDNKRQ